MTRKHQTIRNRVTICWGPRRVWSLERPRAPPRPHPSNNRPVRFVLQLRPHQLWPSSSRQRTRFAMCVKRARILQEARIRRSIRISCSYSARRVRAHLIQIVSSSIRNSSTGSAYAPMTGSVWNASDAQAVNVLRYETK